MTIEQIVNALIPLGYTKPQILDVAIRAKSLTPSNAGYYLRGPDLEIFRYLWRNCAYRYSTELNSYALQENNL
jgi:hypothetical protein